MTEPAAHPPESITLRNGLVLRCNGQDSGNLSAIIRSLSRDEVRDLCYRLHHLCHWQGYPRPKEFGQRFHVEHLRNYASAMLSGQTHFANPFGASQVEPRRKAKAQPRLLSDDELWVRVEEWDRAHIGRLLARIAPGQRRAALLQIGNYCFDQLNEVEA